jgi:hypothetical protein
LCGGLLGYVDNRGDRKRMYELTVGACGEAVPQATDLHTQHYIAINLDPENACASSAKPDRDLRMQADHAKAPQGRRPSSGRIR